MTPAEMFALEEKLRIARKEQGSAHDCSEAGCDTAPDGTPIAQGNWTKKPDLSQEGKDAEQALKDAGVI